MGANPEWFYGWDQEPTHTYVVVDQIGTMIAGPFGTEEAAESAAELAWPDMPWEVVPVVI